MEKEKNKAKNGHASGPGKSSPGKGRKGSKKAATPASGKNKKERKKKKVGCLPKLLVVALVLAGTAGVLRHYGKLRPFLNWARPHAIWVVELARPYASNMVDKAQAFIAEQKDELEDIDKRRQAVREGREPEDMRLVGPETEALVKRFRAEFKPPVIGSKIELAMKQGSTVTGILEELNADGMQVSRESATMTIGRAQLDAVSLARCYKEDYVVFMVAMHHKREADAEGREATIARLKAEREEQKREMAKRRKGKEEPTTPAAKPDEEELPLAKWMRENKGESESELLRARRKRIEEYEAKRQAEGREW